MRRSSLFFGLLMLGGTSLANAQALTMQMSNGWMFAFSGNVNAFMIYENTECLNTNTNKMDPCSKDLSFGTGLLPAFATFDAKGKEGDVDLGVHFGFAPQIETGGHHASYFGTDAAGAQIDMRQVYLTAGGSWGTLTMGKELGLFQRGNILNDMTLLGVGVGGGGRGTALGRIGYGYLYTDFRPQLTYSSKGGKPVQFNVGLFEGLRVGPYDVIQLPRVEAEVTYNRKTSDNSNFKFFLNGAIQTAKDGVDGSSQTGQSSEETLTSAGVGGGVAFDFSSISVMGSGFYTSGMGWLLQGDGIVGGGNFDNGGVGTPDNSGVQNARNSYGFIGQVMFSPKDSKWMFGGSYGANFLKQNDEDKNASGNSKTLQKTQAFVGQITYKWTKSLRWVAEYGNISNYAFEDKQTQTSQGSLGMMLFF
jgi:hypothetical protein